MQRRLTDDEESILDDYVDAAQRLELRGITVPYELGQQMLYEGTTDGRPYVEPPLTDEDARHRPWVIAWDRAEKKVGPLRLIYAHEDGYVTVCSSRVPVFWRHARRATPEEIAAAGLEVTE